MDDDKLTNEEAEAMLKRLTKHFREPVLPMRRYCDGLRTWADCIGELNTPGRSFGHEYVEEDHKFGADYAGHLRDILRDISKSNLLARILYGGEKLRTRPCPEHKGRWSGIMTCPYGCGETGWLPEPEDRPTKQQLLDAIVSLEDRKVKYRERWGADYDTAREEDEIKKCHAMLAFFYPETKGTGIEAPFKPMHHLVISIGISYVYKHPRRTFRIRLDVDPRMRSGEDQGRKLTEIPTKAITDCLAFTQEVLGHLASHDAQYVETHVTTYERLAGYVLEAGRHGVDLAQGSDYLEVSKTAAEKSVRGDLERVRVFVEGRSLPNVKVTVVRATKNDD